MMEPFLKQVAAHYWAACGPEIGTACRFVFPNRRSAAFFRHYLQEEIRLHPAPQAVFAPETLTINDFFYASAGLEPADRITLILELYDCYKAVNPKAEPLDEFVFWGDVLLGDFDDIDKYRVEARSILTNIADLKALQDPFTYLSDTQRKALEQFIAHFRDRSTGLLTVRPDADNPRVKERFLQIWSLLLPLYERFRSQLREKGLAYEGMVYRDLAEHPLSAAFEQGQWVFVGLNALNECERTVLKKLHEAGKAEFVWDYVSDMIRNEDNRSSFFMKENVAAFPQAFPLDPTPEKHVPEIHVVSIASLVGQAKLLPGILAGTDLAHPVGTAVVLPDETLLGSVLNSIPPEIRDINVTMGFPMQEGAVHALMHAAASMQMRIRIKDGEPHFYHRDVTALLGSSLLRRVLTPEEEAACRKVKTAARYYVPQSDLRGGPFLEALFRQVVRDPKAADPEQIRSIGQWQLEVLGHIGRRLTRDDGMLLELDLTRRYHIAVSLLLGKGEALLGSIVPATWFRLLERLLGPQSVPFNGEPLKGLQIMGPLETRTLDFRDLIILSCNEGVFPGHSVSASFIPMELRRGFSLPTREFQDAVAAYYFYRLLQRAERVWLLYDSRTEGIRSGEESRFIKQLQYYFHVPVVRHIAAAPMLPPTPEGDIPKTPEDIEALRSRPLSASVLKSYLNCPAMFYYAFVCRLREDEPIADSLDQRMLGNVYHAVMQRLYTGEGPSPLSVITAEYLESLLAKEDFLKAVIGEAIREEMRSIDVSGRNVVVAGVLLDYVRKTLERDREIAGPGGIRILGLEKHLECEWGGFRFHGYIDRLDSLREGVVRIIDYKTGGVKEDDISIRDDNAGKVVANLFGDNNSQRPQIALQLFLYDLLVHRTLGDGVSLENGIYSPANLFTAGVETYPLSPLFVSMVKDRLAGTLAEMTDPSVPFRRCDDPKTCAWCDFKTLCGR